ncbi:hypothetical protein [[Eubacterium] cellulosolvens]
MKTEPVTIKYIIIILLVVSAILTGASQLMVWGSLDVDTKIGPAKASLEADFFEHGVNYEINISGNLSIGIGGIGGEINEVIQENKTFLTGLGDFQENIGLILDSYKDKRYLIKTSILDPETSEFKDTRVWVDTHAELVPWWPVGMAQKYTVKVTLDEPGNCENVVVNKIKIILWREFDNTKQVYGQASEPLVERSPQHIISRKNDSRSYELEATISEDYGRVGIIAIVELIVNDKNGNEIPQNTIINLGKSNPMPSALTTNIYTMETGEGINIVLMVLAFPISMINIVFMIIAIPFVYMRKRGCFILVLFATILGVLAIAFFINGINTLINLLDSVLDTPVRENFTWNATIVIPSLAVGMLIAAAVLTFVIRPPKEKKKDKKKGRGKAHEKTKMAKPEEEALPTFEVLGKPGKEPEQKPKPKKGSKKGQAGKKKIKED